MAAEVDRSSDIYRQTVPFIVLATVIVATRAAVRKFRSAQYGPDDYVIVVALVRSPSLPLVTQYLTIVDRFLLGPRLLQSHIVRALTPLHRAYNRD